MKKVSDMKNTFLHKMASLFLGALLLVSAGCQDILEREFKDPESYEAPPEELAGGMFTQTLYQWKVYVQDYGEWWWSLGGWGITAYSQVGLRPLTNNYAVIYQYMNEVESGDGFSADNGVRSYFEDMYTKMKTWAVFRDLMETEYNKDEAIYNDVMVFYQLTTVIKDFAMIRNVDFFNSIPYKNALKGGQGVLNAEYDDPLETSKAILDDLEEIANTLEDNYSKMSAKAKETFVKQDLAFGGDILKWKQYINALRLKYAVRMSGADETYAKAQIASAIQSGLPTTDMAWELPFAQASVLGGGGTVIRAWYERFTSYYIPNIILERMNHQGSQYTAGIDDPRLPVIASPTRYNDYRGVRMDQTFHQPQYDAIVAGKNFDGTPMVKPDYVNQSIWDNYQKRYIQNAARSTSPNLSYWDINNLSMYNPATYIYCDFPVYMMSMAEVDLFLAEVAAKGLATTGKTAGAHLSDAVKHSTDFWYWVASLSIADKTAYARYCPSKPDAADINTYAAFIASQVNAATNIEDQMEIIMQQKYIHLNLMAPNECWTELRRTRHPKLEPISFPPYYTNITPHVERIKYPTSEQLNNTDNYAKVKDQDNYSTPIFWIPAAKKTESYYGTSYVPVEAYNN